MMTLKCPSCGTALKLREGYVKTLKEFKCLRCGAPIPVPGAEPAPTDAAASTRHIPVRPILPGATPPPPPSSEPAARGTISVTCSGCGRTMNLRPDLAGKKVRCKQCQTINLVPESASEAASAVSAPPSPSPSATTAAAPSPSPAPPPPPVSAAGATVRDVQMDAPPPQAASTAGPAGEAVPSPSTSEMDELRRRAEKAELALRALAAQQAERTADLLHQIETLKRELAEARAVPPGLSRETVARVVDEWTQERRRRLDEEVADLRRRLGLT